MGHPSDVFENRHPDQSPISQQQLQKLMEELIVFDPFSIARATGSLLLHSAVILNVLGAVRESPGLRCIFLTNALTRDSRSRITPCLVLTWAIISETWRGFF